jgi:hypothetical protein
MRSPGHAPNLPTSRKPTIAYATIAVDRWRSIKEQFATLPQAQSYDVVQLYSDRGMKSELIHSYTGAKGEKRYSLRIGKGFRAIAFRDGVWLRVLGLYPDHDSAYGAK